MADFEFTFDDAFRFADKMAKAPEVVREELVTATNRLTIRAEGFVKEKTPVRTGHGRRSVAHTPAVFAGGTVTGSVGTNVTYMKWVEDGRGPVVASPGKMLRFEIGGQVFYRKRVRAAKGHHMFRDAKARIRPMVPQEYRAAQRRIVARLGGA